MTGARNVRGGILMLSGGLFLGMLMSLYAFVPMVPRVPSGLDQYDDLPRRLVRLAHVAAIMLPIINIVLGGWLDRLPLTARTRERVSWALLLGGAGIPVALLVEAFWPPARELHLSGLPVVAFCSAVFVCGAGAARWTPRAQAASADDRLFSDRAPTPSRGARRPPRATRARPVREGRAA